MSRTPRSFSLCAIILMAISAQGCSSETTAADASDALAVDSMLARQVQQANEAADLEIAEPEYQPPVIGSVEAVPAPDAAPVARPQPAPATRTQPAPTPPAVSAPRRISDPPLSRRSTLNGSGAASSDVSRATPPRAAERAPSTGVSRVATVPAGTRLVLEASRRVCVNTSRVGDRFSARVARTVTGPLGTVIRQGARATVEVTAVTGAMGEERLMISVRSATVGGRTYQLSSRVTDFELDRSPGAYRCIPSDGNITAELVQPLRVTM